MVGLSRLGSARIVWHFDRSLLRLRSPIGKEPDRAALSVSRTDSPLRLLKQLHPERCSSDIRQYTVTAKMRRPSLLRSTMNSSSICEIHGFTSDVSGLAKTHSATVLYISLRFSILLRPRLVPIFCQTVSDLLLAQSWLDKSSSRRESIPGYLRSV